MQKGDKFVGGELQLHSSISLPVYPCTSSPENVFPCV
jgi:hypothetical protein